MSSPPQQCSRALTDKPHIDNFSTGSYLKAIKSDGKLHTATGDGKIPFVSTKDIAAVAFKALTTPKIDQTSYHVNGPESLSYDEVRERPPRPSDLPCDCAFTDNRLR